MKQDFNEKILSLKKDKNLYPFSELKMSYRPYDLHLPTVSNWTNIKYPNDGL